MNLDHFRARVHAAVTTNQCLDYAQDVTDLLNEVERLRAGIEAGWEFFEAAYLKATRHTVLLNYADMQRVEQEYQTVSRMWNAIHDAMGQGWRP